MTNSSTEPGGNTTNSSNSTTGGMVTTTTTGGTAVPTPPAFTPPANQEELDRIIGARLAREREKFVDYNDLKAKAEAHDAALDAARTDQEKAVEAARKEGQQAATEQANARLVRSEARALAAAAKFRDPADAVPFLDLSKVAVAEDGTVDEAAIKAQLDKLAADKPYLVDDGKKPAPKADPSQGGGGGDSTPSVAKGRDLWEARHKTTA